VFHDKTPIARHFAARINECQFGNEVRPLAGSMSGGSFGQFARLSKANFLLISAFGVRRSIGHYGLEVAIRCGLHQGLPSGT